MYIGLLHIHNVSVTLFFLIYLIKVFLLLTNKTVYLQKFTSKIKIPEIIISVLFLVSGIIILTMKESISTFQIIKLISVIVAIPLAIIGFKKSNKLVVIISFLLIIVSYGLGEINKKRVQKIEVNSEIITNPENPAYNKTYHGAVLFEANCVSCHGKDGKKCLEGAIDLSVSKTDKLILHTIILEGKNKMPSYKKIMSETEIEALIEHLEKLKK